VHYKYRVLLKLCVYRVMFVTPINSSTVTVIESSNWPCKTHCRGKILICATLTNLHKTWTSIFVIREKLWMLQGFKCACVIAWTLFVQSSVEVKNAWSYTSTLPYIFMAWYILKHRDNCTFTFYHICLPVWFKLPVGVSVKVSSERLAAVTAFCIVWKGPLSRDQQLSLIFKFTIM
jgi:hypothetical protein